MSKVVPRAFQTLARQGQFPKAYSAHESDDNSASPVSDRVLYARKGGPGETVVISDNDGEKIDLDTAMKLKEIVWGSANIPLKSEWEGQGFVFQPSDQPFSYALKCPQNGTKNVLITIQAYLVKCLLFDKRGGGRKNVQQRSHVNRSKSQSTKSAGNKDLKTCQMLRINERAQNELLATAIAEILIRAAGGRESIFCLPGDENCFEPTANYGIDGVTEKLRFLKAKKEDELRNILKKYNSSLTSECSSGLLCVIYSVILSRGFDRLEQDMQDQAANPLLDGDGIPSLSLIMLILVGQALPYLHNGTLTSDSKKTAGIELFGLGDRSDIGLLIWDLDDYTTATRNLGSRLKTPTFPVWLTICNGNYGLLFNPNKELMRSYHAENRFNLFYYSDAELKKEEMTENTMLTIDTRGGSKLFTTGGGSDQKGGGSTDPPNQVGGQNSGGGASGDGEYDGETTTPLIETVISTKWAGCTIDWNNITPYV